MQNTATENTQTVVKPYKINVFEQYITWRALGGLIIDEEDPNSPNKLRIMPLQEFCQTYKVNRDTILRWKKYTPNLAELIEQRRNEVVPLSRVSAVWNQVLLMAMQNKDKRAAVEAQKLLLGHFGNLQLPIQRQEIEHQFNAADLLTAAKTAGIIEGEVVDGSNDHS